MTTSARDNKKGPKKNARSGLVRSICLFVLLPTIVGAVYFGFIASDRYVAEARYAIRTGGQAPTGGFLESMLSSGGFGGSSSQDAEIVRSYILSLDMLTALDRRFDIKAHYASPEIDWLSRLDPEASNEDALKYMERRIEIVIDRESGISTLTVQAFDPHSAQTLTDLLLELSETLVNDMSERITEDTLRFSRQELARMEREVRQATSDLTSFRKETRSVDPGEETSAVLGIVTDLEMMLAGARAELVEASSVMQMDSARVRNLQTRVGALETQVLEERDRLANGQETDLTSLIDRYQPLVLEEELAMQRYASALTSLEASRAEAQRQQSYLIAFVPPQLPSEATEPRRAWMMLTVFAFASLIFAIGGLIWSAIKDHMGR